MTAFVIPLAFFCEFVDSSLGMGFGTILSPVLLLMGFEALDVVPAVLFSECITGNRRAPWLITVCATWISAPTLVTPGSPGVLAACAVTGTVVATTPGDSPASSGSADLDRDTGAHHGRADSGSGPSYLPLHVASDRCAGDSGFVQQGHQRRRLRSLGDRGATALRSRRPQRRRDHVAIGGDHLFDGIRPVLCAETRRQLGLAARRDDGCRPLGSAGGQDVEDGFPRRPGGW